MKLGYLLACFFLVMVCGCGYRTGSLLPDADIHTVYVKNFRNETFNIKIRRVNKTSQLGIETKLTDEIIRRFMLDGTLKVTAKENADVVLEGRIISFSLSPRQFDSTDRRLVAQYGVSIGVELTLTDSKTGEIIWVDDVSKGATYFVTGSLARSEEDAVDEASAELARDIVIRVVEGW